MDGSGQAQGEKKKIQIKKRQNTGDDDTSSHRAECYGFSSGKTQNRPDRNVTVEILKGGEGGGGPQ